ncbi:MAG TPA: threonine/serine exporter family protein [Kofleriaceae bacterium]|nr:threonine/serine exporter family protein [Kofleriaceae bacterium]
MADDAAIGFVLELARALHRYGTPAHRLEEALAVVSRELGLTAELFATPTTIIISFGEPRELRTRMLRVDSGELDMAKLAAVDALADEVAAGRVTPAEGMARLEQITHAPRVWSRPMSTIVHAITAAAIVVFFGGSARDVAAAGSIGLAIGVLSLFMSRTTAQTQVFELVGAAVASFASGAAAHYIDGISSPVVTVAALVPLLPGLSLTTAMIELATRMLIAGTARLMSAVIVLLELVIGVALGERAARELFAPHVAIEHPLPSWAQWPALLAASIAVAVVVQAEIRALPWIILACAVGYTGAREGSAVLGPEIGVLGGAFALGMLCNLYARVLDRPAQVPMVPALLVIVPGSLGFRGMSSLLGHDTLTGVETTFAMFVVAMAIVGGLLIANATLSPRRVL